MHNSFPSPSLCFSIETERTDPRHGGLRSGAELVTRHAIPLLAFGDLTVDDEWESPARTVTESDVVAFAGLSGDFNPLHVDHEAARAGHFGKPVAHGLLGL